MGMQPNQLSALLHLSSPGLPIGAYSYSQGFEAAVEAGIIEDEASASEWIRQQLELMMAQCEAPVWTLLYEAWRQENLADVRSWNAWFLASRESQETRRETEQMGWSLIKLATDLEWGRFKSDEVLLGGGTLSLPTAHAYCIYALDIDKQAGLCAYLFTWLENQVMAAIKTVPLGQMAGQRILNNGRRSIPQVCHEAFTRAAQCPPRLRTLAPQFAILSSRHETQYSRLFRS